MCEICTTQYELMSKEFRAALDDYKQDRAEGGVRGEVSQRVHDVAMLLIELRHPVFTAWLAAVGIETIAALEESGVNTDVLTV